MESSCCKVSRTGVQLPPPPVLLGWVRWARRGAGREFWEISVDWKLARVIVFNYLGVVSNRRLCRLEFAIDRVVVCVELRRGAMVGARLGRRRGGAESAGRILLLWRGCEAGGVARILGWLHFFDSRTTLSCTSREHSCTLGQNWGMYFVVVVEGVATKPGPFKNRRVRHPENLRRSFGRCGWVGHPPGGIREFQA